MFFPILYIVFKSIQHYLPNKNAQLLFPNNNTHANVVICKQYSNYEIISYKPNIVTETMVFVV